MFSNPTVAKVMNESFVPHWVNVRDVPKVTIDFGKGRVLERTLNGNIATYICLPNGQTLDVITGLNDEATYLRRLKEGLELYRAIRKQPELQAGMATLRYHEAALSGGHAAGIRALNKKHTPTIGFTTVTYEGDLKGLARYEETHAITKAVVEGPLKRAIAIDPDLPQDRLPKPVDPLAAYLARLNPASKVEVEAPLKAALQVPDNSVGEGRGVITESKRAVEIPLKNALGGSNADPFAGLEVVEFGKAEAERVIEYAFSKGGVEAPLKEALAELPVNPASKGMVEAPLKGALAERLVMPASKGMVEAPLKGALVELLVKPASKERVERPLGRALAKRAEPSEKEVLITKARPTLSADSRHNETLRRKVHRLLLLHPSLPPEALAKRVYKEIMHVDIEDPYLGLAPMVIGGEIGRTAAHK